MKIILISYRDMHLMHIDILIDIMMSKEIENGRVCRIQKVGEVMGAVALDIILKEFYGSFL